MTAHPPLPDALVRLQGQRILFLSEATTFGGHEAMAVRAASLLSRHGASVVFRLWQGNARLQAAIERENDQGASVILQFCSVKDSRLNPLRSMLRWRDVLDVWRYLRREPFSARILVQGRIESGSVALLAAWLGRIALVSYLPMAHRLVDINVPFLPRLRDWVNHFYYRRPAAFITISSGIAEQLQSMAPAVPARVVENWIAPPHGNISRASARQRLGWPLDGKIVALVGRIDFHQKGHDWLVNAMQTQAGHDTDFMVAFVGDGPDLDRLHKMVQDAGLSARMIFVPWSDGNMDCLYAAIDGLVLPSNYEGVPLVMLEALARNIPVTASNIDGMAEWLPVEATFDRRQPAKILQAVRLALDSCTPVRFASAFERARQRADDTQYACAWAEAIELSAH